MPDAVRIDMRVFGVHSLHACDLLGDSEIDGSEEDRSEDGSEDDSASAEMEGRGEGKGKSKSRGKGRDSNKDRSRSRSRRKSVISSSRRKKSSGASRCMEEIPAGYELGLGVSMQQGW